MRSWRPGLRRPQGRQRALARPRSGSSSSVGSLSWLVVVSEKGGVSPQGAPPPAIPARGGGSFYAGQTAFLRALLRKRRAGGSPRSVSLARGVARLRRGV